MFHRLKIKNAHQLLISGISQGALTLVTNDTRRARTEKLLHRKITSKHISPDTRSSISSTQRLWQIKDKLIDVNPWSQVISQQRPRGSGIYINAGYKEREKGLKKKTEKKNWRRLHGIII